jgi:crotonobetainyl-CoA:carnitine CoA-transferase CaiB-like acyl-CoA transferase
MTGACSGLRVLDLSTGYAGKIATMVLADFGAEVIRIDPSADDASLTDPAGLLVHRGKKSVILDLEGAEGQAELMRLLPGIDVLVEMYTPMQANARGIVHAAFAKIAPRLVHCSITGFGRTGPYAEVKADDALVLAKAGILRDQSGWHQDRTRPVFRSGKDGTHFSGMIAVQGILAALRVRDLTGKGQFLETNMLAALSCRQNPDVRWLLREGEALPSEASGDGVTTGANALPHHLDPRLPSLAGIRVETKDGRWLVHSHSEPHFFPAWIETIGMDWIWQDERFKGAPHRIADPADRDELIEKIRARMKEKTAAEWIEAYIANGNVCGDMIQTTRDSLYHRQSVEGGWVVTIEDPRVGKIVEVGPIARIRGAGNVETRPAPLPGAHTDEVLDASVAALQGEPTGVEIKRPLEGITILESAYYYATPFGTALLAELGARIIKIEPIGGDPYRRLAAAGDPVLALGHNNMARAMQGKQSICIDLKDERGQKIVRELAARADMFLHNFRKGVPEKLGCDEAALRAVNPDIVYEYGASYGTTGPYARQPAIDPVIAAFAGTTAYQAGEGNDPLTERGADPVAGATSSAAMMLGLFARHRTGKGQYVEPAMIVSNMYLNFLDALDYAGKQQRHPLDSLERGIGATYRLFETAPIRPGTVIPDYANQDPHWVFLAIDRNDEFRRFCMEIDHKDLAADPRFDSEARRWENRAVLADLLEAVFLTRTAQEWEDSLLAVDVGCIVADAMSNFAFLYKDSQAKALGLTQLTEHASIGRYYRHSPLLTFHRTPAQVTPMSSRGEYTKAILAELGYDAAAIQELGDAGVVFWQEEESAMADARS